MSEAKQVIDTGEKNNSSTGDVLYDGGVKININFDSIYNAFGDQRLFGATQGAGTQYIHASGFYQKKRPEEYSRSVEMGSLHDLDTTTGPLTVRLPEAKQGECIVFINSNGSISNSKYVNFVCQDGDGFDKTGGVYKHTYSNSQIVFWGDISPNGTGIWKSKLDALYGNYYAILDETVEIGHKEIEFDVCPVSDYVAIKLILNFEDEVDNIIRTSEVLLTINRLKMEVYSVEYGISGNHGDDEVLNISFDIVGEMIRCKASTKTGKKAYLRIRTTELL